MSQQKRRTMAWAQMREVAVAAQADPKTVQREVAEPGKVKGMVGERVREALRQFREKRAKAGA